MEAERSSATSAAPSGGVTHVMSVPPGGEETQMPAVTVHQPQSFTAAAPAPSCGMETHTSGPSGDVETTTSAPSGDEVTHQTFTAAASALLQSRAAKLRQVRSFVLSCN